MYLPTHFKQENHVELFDLIQQNPLGSVMVIHDGEIEANHILFELDHSDTELGILRGHIAKANPLAEILNQPLSAYIIFHADQAYISPNWYVAKQQHHRVVPTWNYRVVHVQGCIRKVENIQYLRGLLARLTRKHEATQAQAWKMGDAPHDFIEAQLEKIIAIEVEIQSITGKFKVSQNRSQADISNISNALKPSNPEMAESIRKYDPKVKNA